MRGRMEPSISTPGPSSKRGRFHLPLYQRVIIGVALGIVVGVVFKTGEIIPGLRSEHLSQLGLLVIRLLKALAVPLILFAIIDAFLRVHISGRAGGRLILICLVNVSVAFAIGLTLMNTLRPGDQWRGRLNEIAGLVEHEAGPLARADVPKVPLNPLASIAGYVPESLVEPFVKNNIITVVLLGLLAGAALRKVKTRRQEEGQAASFRAVEQFVESVFHALIQMLQWVVEAVPFAVFGVVAHVVGRSGITVFHALGGFLFVILLGLGIHSLVYYPLVAWVVGRKPPREYLGKGADAILTGLSCNSSLATVPVTLRCLTEKMHVSDESARLSACVGTNLNNDGITLYEAMAALFLAQAYGFELSLGQQLTVVLASLMAGIGIAGIPEAGLIVLPLVLGAAGLPEEAIVVAIPLIMPVDWVIARARSGVNVMSDMLVAILLDRKALIPRKEH